MRVRRLPGRLGAVRMYRELPIRVDLPLVFDELDYQMACQTYLWALPLVSFAQWRHQHREIFGATDYDVVHYVTYADRLGLITANTTTPYVIGFIDLSVTGPVVVEIPPGPIAGGISDSWQREIAVIGEMGPDECRGGRHLIVPVDVEVPETDGEYFVHRATGVHVMVGFRTLDLDPVVADELVHGVRIRPLTGEGPTTQVISPEGRRWSGAQPRGVEYWMRLHDIYQREIIDERDRFYLAMLHRLGIERDAEFDPDEPLRRLLTEAAMAGELMAQANSFATRAPEAPYWPDRRWELVLHLDHSDQRGPYYDQLLERTAWFYQAVGFSEAMKSVTPGKGQAYLGVYADAAGDWLDGGGFYTLRVPADPPAKLFWSVTVYDVATRCLINNQQQRGDRGSLDTDMVVNADGSVELFFGPAPPPSGTTNWVQTVPGRHWFSYFRCYGPLEAYFDRSWKLEDVIRRG
ncbi:DUF1254 domain-containing protein [Nocardia sp. NPDC005366]|uniref:DUF1254 domain-containing protein n=1 Tax=Nocardia sp. NPDC005366 TaxID=3156878 RepID=UPI0033B28B13